ncbi:hypothetical protein G4D61_11215 [Bacillus ginsengihumi]|uniref:Uncharacterized protein n=1 Tax=Heyndrickxia ginsengihumi TaxID=363870 RepID=A0A0A6VDL6_9BACI|nr:hypothetical protein [Heyndrickxia ginsengihumi]KHD85666.1 hypothetical protein NG54_07805 [Heyndrickxia ginsengihumi]NEY20525.1 hypothetical protein [Heyndrickxia ginsengihumi]
MIMIDQFLKTDFKRVINEYHCSIQLCKSITEFIRENNFEKSIQFTEDLLKSLKVLQEFKQKKSKCNIELTKIAHNLVQKNVKAETIKYQKREA